MAVEEQIVEAFVREFQNILMLSCFVALGILLFALAVLKAMPEITDAIRRFMGMDRFGKVLCLICIVGAVMYGGSKGTVSYDGGIKSNPSQQNVVTNDLVQVYWVKEASAILPNDAPVYIDHRLTGTTNEWVNIGQSTVAAGYWSGTVVNATNYDYQVWAYYIPPEPVRTNGVWSYTTMRDINNREIIPLRADVEVNGMSIIEPIKKRRDEQ